MHVLSLDLDLAIAALVGTLGVAADGHRRTPSAYVENLLMVNTWLNDRPSFNAPAWSISSEWSAYLLAPLLFVAAVRVRRTAPALVLAAVSYAAMLAVFATLALPNGNLEHLFYVRIMGEFVGGMLLCLAWVRGRARLGRLVVVLPMTLLAPALVPAAADGHHWAAPALGLGVTGFAASSGWVTSALSWPGIVAAGEASYPLYMTHLLIQPFAHHARLWAEGSGWASALVVAALVGVLGATAWLVHVGVEQPARRRLRAPRGVPARTAPAADAERRVGVRSERVAPPRCDLGHTCRPLPQACCGEGVVRAIVSVLRPELLHPPAATAPADAHEVHGTGVAPRSRGPRSVGGATTVVATHHAGRAPSRRRTRR